MPAGLPDPKRVSFAEFIRDPATLANASPEEISDARKFLNEYSRGLPDYSKGEREYLGDTEKKERPSTTTSTTLPRRHLGDEQDLRDEKARVRQDAKRSKYAEEEARIRAELDAIRKNPTASSGAFVGEGGYPNETPMPEALPPAKGLGQNIAEIAMPTAGSMTTAGVFARQAARLPIPNPLAKGAVVAGAAIAGAGLGGTGASFTLEGAKYALGTPDAPDSIDDAMGTALTRGGQEMVGELWGQGLGVLTSRLSPYRRSVTPETYSLMEDQARRLRMAYEEIGGKPLVERARSRWNPFLRQPTELDDSAVVLRLKERGLDPQAAREVALSGGLQPSVVENSIVSRLQGIFSGSKVSQEERLLARNRAKATLVQTAMLEDIGLKYADKLPAEDWGKALNAAINGRFDILKGAREAGMHAIGEDLPPFFTFNIGGLKRRTSAGPGSTLLHGLPDKAKFEDIAMVRSNIVSMANDLHVSPEERYDAAMLAVQLDNAVSNGTPRNLKNLRAEFDNWRHADNEMNFEQFNTAFMTGMLKRPKVARKYAEDIIKLGDSDSYLALERALENTPEGRQIFGNVKAAIGERFMEKARVGEIIRPSKLRLAIDTESRGYGRVFLNRTLGPEYVKNAERYAAVSETVEEAMRKAGALAGGSAALGTFGNAYGAMRKVFRGTIGPADALPIIAAMFSPKVVSSALGSKTASKLLLKTAENVAKGYNPKTTARLAGRALAAIGVTPEEILQGSGLLPGENEAGQRLLQGDPFGLNNNAT